VEQFGSNQIPKPVGFKKDDGLNTINEKIFQTGKLQQVGNSNDIGIMATTSGGKTT